jgi:two-component SAPR family response regulator
MKAVQRFIIVDDDLLNNTICRVAIKNALGEVNTKSFTEPEEGLAFIEREYNYTTEPTILFLDINMPTLTGWEFLEQYDKFSEKIKNQISVFIVSSSVDQHDRNKAKSNQYVRGFLSKPLSKETILSVAGECR